MLGVVYHENFSPFIPTLLEPYVMVLCYVEIRFSLHTRSTYGLTAVARTSLWFHKTLWKEVYGHYIFIADICRKFGIHYSLKFQGVFT